MNENLPDDPKHPLVGRFSLADDSSKLQSGGEPPDNGEMDARLAKLEAILPTLATKADLGVTNTEVASLKTDVAGLKAAIVEVKADAKATAGELRAAIAETKSDIIKWLSGAVFAAVAILLSAMFFLAGQVARSTVQPQPIVIQLPPFAGAQSATAPVPTPLQIK